MNVIRKLFALVLLLALLFTHYSKSQITCYTVNPGAEINVGVTDSSKLSLFVIMAGDVLLSDPDYERMTNLFTLFNSDPGLRCRLSVYLVFVKIRRVGGACYFKDWRLNGKHPTGSFNLSEPYLILDTDSKPYKDCINSGVISGPDFFEMSCIGNDDCGLVNLLKFETLYTLLKVVGSSPCDTDFPTCEKELALATKRIQSLQDSCDAFKPAVSTGSDIFKKISVSGVPLSKFISKNEPEGLTFKDMNFSGFHFNFLVMPFSKLSHWGVTLNTGTQTIRGHVALSDQEIPYVDTLTVRYSDSDDDTYTRIVYASGLEEEFKIRYLCVAPLISWCPTKGNKIAFSIETGPSFSAVTKATYRSNGAKISFGGFYPQYPKADTMFSGMYDYYQDTSYTTQSQTLLVRSSWFSWVASAGFSVRLWRPDESKFASLWLDTGVRYITGVNLLFQPAGKHQFAPTPDQYNSLLYRSGKLNPTNISITTGISYQF